MPVQIKHRNPSQIAFVVGVMAILLVVTGLVGYNLWRLRTVAIDNQLGSAAQYANAFEEHLTQTLGVVDINLVSLGEKSISKEALQAVIRNARYLRSISVVGAKGNIEASTEPRNIGVAFAGKSFLPESSGPLPLLRVAPLMQGRDLYDALAIPQGSEAPAQSFIAVRRDVAQLQGGFVTLVAVINPDYFLNYYGRNLNVDLAEVQLLRLDGGLIVSTAQRFFPASKDNTLVVEMLSKAESGRFYDDLHPGAARLSAYRVSKFFPFVAVVHLDLAKGLDTWRDEARWTATFVFLVLALSLAMAVYYFLRMQRLALERENSVLALNNQKYALDQHAIVSITTPSGVITYANDSFCSISGYSREELLGKHHRLVKSAQHPPAFFDALWHTISQGDVWHGEVCNRKKNGGLYWVSATIVPLLGSNGMVEQYIAIRTDITHQKQIEQSLEVAKNAAEQANVAKSQFLANMSHEIRTPMNAILGILQLLQRTTLTPEQQDYAGKTEGAARSLLGLLNDILDFSKAEAGKMALDHRPFALDQVLRDISVILASNLGDKPVRLTLDVAPDVPLGLMGDDMRLSQILVNLGGNAIKFTEAGEVLLQVRLRESNATHATLEFLVRDTGIGIDPQHLEHIFDGFSQAESSTTRRFGGTGLGLAICQQLVHLMGGDLQVQSTPGQGSSFFFSVSLPITGLATPQKQQAATALGKKLPRLTGMRLLVVEDNKINQMVAKGLLSQEGAIITLAENGALGVEAVANTQPLFHAVLMDLQMPVMDGFEATRKIRHELAQTALPIIAMTANVMAADREACLQAGMNDHVGKPFELDHLIAVLNKHTGFAAPEPSGAQVTAPEQTDHPAGDLDIDDALARMGGDARMLANVLQSFAREVVQAPQQLLDQLTAGKHQRAAGLLHSLKGMASTVGARHLAAVAARLEQWVKAGAPPQEQDAKLDSLRLAIQALSATMAPVLHAYEAEHNQTAQAAAEDGSALDRVQLRQALIELTGLLKTSDLQALKAHACLEQVFGHHLSQELKPLKDAMALMDFADAMVHCADLLQTYCESP